MNCEIQRLSRALQLRTVAPNADTAEPNPNDTSELEAFQAFVRTAFPTLWTRAAVHQPNAFRLVFTLAGRNGSLDPVILLAHYDVVDAPDADRWTYPPFAGTVAGDHVWGRGAIDDKGPLMALLEALEALVLGGWWPERTLIVALGGDEEIGGAHGARATAAALIAQGVRAACILDEGAILARGMLSLVRQPVALIGIAEKGVVDFTLTARGAEGHASMPPAHSALGVLGRALHRIETRPFPTRLTPAVVGLLQALAAHAHPLLRPLLRFPTLCAPALKAVLAGTPSTAALIRTTVAPTMARGAHAPNVLPATAQANLNVRVLPGETVAGTLARLRARVRNLPVQIEIASHADAGEPLDASTANPWAYTAIAAAIGAHFPEAIVAPYLVTATTDSRHFRALGEPLLRFVPFELDRELLSTVHGTDERVSTAAYLQAIDFYRTALQALARGDSAVGAVAAPPAAQSAASPGPTEAIAAQSAAVQGLSATLAAKSAATPRPVEVTAAQSAATPGPVETTNTPPPTR